MDDQVQIRLVNALERIAIALEYMVDEVGGALSPNVLERVARALEGAARR
jgi:hypothetical protein